MLGSKSDLLPPNRVFYAQRLKDYSNTRKQVRSYSLEMEYYYFLIDFTLVKGVSHLILLTFLIILVGLRMFPYMLFPLIYSKIYEETFKNTILSKEDSKGMVNKKQTLKWLSCKIKIYGVTPFVLWTADLRCGFVPHRR